MISFICVIFKNDPSKLFAKQKQIQTLKTSLWLPKGKGWGVIQQEFEINNIHLLYIKQIINKDFLLYSKGNSTHYSVISYTEKNLKKEWTNVYG